MKKKSKGHKNIFRKIGRYWQILGPGLITGASDDDPSGIATYSQTGARYGFQLLWLAGLTLPLMAIIQEMCARIGLVTGQGLATIIRKHYPRWVLYTCTALLLLANAFNIGADLGAMAKAAQLLNPALPFALLVIGFTILSLYLQIFLSYAKYARYLKWLALILVTYILAAFLVPNLDWQKVLQGSLVPSITFSKDQIILICGILGTTISPYLFFWQTSQIVEEQILQGRTTIKARLGATKKEIRDMRLDVWSGMFFSNIAMFFIILTCAATLFQHNITNINTAADAARALEPLAGQAAYLLFSLGIIGTGLLAIPVLAGSTAYALSESFQLREGLFYKFHKALAFYCIIIISVVLGLLLNFIGLDPIKALIYSAVVNGLVAPIILILIILISSNRGIMGEHTNSKITSTIGWIITGTMIIAGLATIFSFFI